MDSGKLPKAMPPTEYTFPFEVRGSISGKVFAGDFKYRIPNLKARALAERKRVELNGGVELVDSSVLQLHYMIAYLRFTLVETPEWWEKNDYGYNLLDYNVVKAVFDKVEELEASYQKMLWGEPDEQGKDTTQS